MVNEALQYPDSAVAVGPDGDIAAAAIWFPPGADEIREASLEPHAALTQHLLGADGAAAIDEVGRRFGEARPSEPHAYLTLLAVAPEWRGRGAGMGLLRHTLTRFDETGIASYLESSNPVNDARYERLGYRRVGAVEVPSGARASTYWRDPA
nr:GNAT family N-acetyltransferase [Leucobacter luti]